MNPLLLIKRRYRLGPHHFAARGVNGLVGNMFVHSPDNIFDQISAVIDFRHDPVGMKLAVCIDCPVAPTVRRSIAGFLNPGQEERQAASSAAFSANSPP
jgi:hypothetical protein